MAYKPKAATEATRPTGAESSVGETKTTSVEVENPNDIAAMMADIERRQAGIKKEELKFKEGFDHSAYHFAFFRPDQMQGESLARLHAEYYVQVTRDGNIGGVPFADMFEPEAFDPDSNAISYGIRKGEQYLWVQPNTVYQAVLALRSKKAFEYANPKTSEKMRNMKDDVRRDVGRYGSVIESDFGAEDGPEGWDD